MKSLSPYRLWFFIDTGDTPMSHIGEEPRCADYRLSYLFNNKGYKLNKVVISNDLETYYSMDDLHYLKAMAYFTDDAGDECQMKIYPRYMGDDDEWALLMMDLECEDLDIRFCLSENKMQPLWISVVKNSDVIPLTGDVIEWDMLKETDIQMWPSCDDDIEMSGISEEAEDLTLEAVDGTIWTFNGWQ